MAGTTATTIQKCTAHSTKGFHVQWRALTTALGHHLDLNNVDASKLILLVAHDSSKAAMAHYIAIGTSDSASSGAKGSTHFYPYSAAKIGPLKVGSSVTIKATAFTKMRATGSTDLMAVSVLGPFETARFKDSDGYMNIAKYAFGSTTAFVGAILLP